MRACCAYITNYARARASLVKVITYAAAETQNARTMRQLTLHFSSSSLLCTRDARAQVCVCVCEPSSVASVCEFIFAHHSRERTAATAARNGKVVIMPRTLWLVTPARV